MSRCYICNACPSTDGIAVSMTRNEDGLDICVLCLESGKDALTEFGYDGTPEEEDTDASSCPFKGGTAADRGGGSMGSGQKPFNPALEPPTGHSEEDVF